MSIRVHLQYPWRFPDSPYYKYLINSPPEGIEYLNITKQKGVITNKNLFRISNFLKRFIRGLLNILYPSMANAHRSPHGDYDLIHCAHCLSKNKDKPWVADMEAFWQLWVVGARGFKNKKKMKEILFSHNCKKLLPWTSEVRDEFLKHFPTLGDKLEVVYPAIPSAKLKKKPHKGINLLFVGRYFYSKGGLHALEVMYRITKKFKEVNAMIVSEVPEELKKKYQSDKIKIYGLMPQEKLLSLYALSDIFIYPGYSDSFGFMFLESMSYGLPIVTVDGCSRKEIVTDGKEGFVVPYPSSQSLHDFGKGLEGEDRERVLTEIEKKVIQLIKDPKLRKEMGNRGVLQISKGRFSVESRNKKLKKIYEKAIKS